MTKGSKEGFISFVILRNEESSASCIAALHSRQWLSEDSSLD
jgi:hypothetical protein